VKTNPKNLVQNESDNVQNESDNEERPSTTVRSYHSIQKEDSELWKSFKDGDLASFTEIYTKYFPVLFNYGHQFTMDKGLVKDLIQDLFIELKQKRKTLGTTDSIRYYLMKCYRRKLFYQLNKNKRNASVEQTFSNDQFEIEVTHESRLINSQLNEEIKSKLSRALNDLSERQREILIYFYYEGFSYKEITSIMGFSRVEYARVLMSRSLTTLRDTLGKWRKT